MASPKATASTATSSAFPSPPRHRQPDPRQRRHRLDPGRRAFPPERGKAFAPHRNRVENNRIVDSGPEDGIAIDVQGEVESITLTKTRSAKTRAPEKRVGVRIGKDTRDIQLQGNAIEGVAEKVVDLR